MRRKFYLILAGAIILVCAGCSHIPGTSSTKTVSKSRNTNFIVDSFKVPSPREYRVIDDALVAVTKDVYQDSIPHYGKRAKEITRLVNLTQDGISLKHLESLPMQTQKKFLTLMSDYEYWEATFRYPKNAKGGINQEFYNKNLFYEKCVAYFQAKYGWEPASHVKAYLNFVKKGRTLEDHANKIKELQKNLESVAKEAEEAERLYRQSREKMEKEIQRRRQRSDVQHNERSSFQS